MSGWRYIAQRLDGVNPPEFVDFDLPLTDVSIEEVLTGINSLTGTVSPEVLRLKAPDGSPLLKEWGTAIFAEKDGEIFGGGILERSGLKGEQWNLECIGYVGAAKDEPYLDSTFFVEEDPLNIFRHILTWLQAQPAGNLELQVDGTLSGIQIGTVLEQVEFDTQSGPVSFESGPYKLAWYLTQDLFQNLTDLASETPFDWREYHQWDPNSEEITHHLEIGYPRLGVRRNDLRFVIGENIFEIPDVDLEGDEYASDVLVLGAGEGPAMVRATSRRDTGLLRRTAVVSDTNIRSLSGAKSVADRELASRSDTSKITDFVVRDHPHAPAGAARVGDEILLQGSTGWQEVDTWVRILSRSIKPDDSNSVTLSVVPTSRLGA